MLIKAGVERAKRKDVKVYALLMYGVVQFIGTAEDIASKYNMETAYVHRQIRLNRGINGQEVRIATKSDVEIYNFQKQMKAEENTHVPQKYKDSHSARFTPL